MNPFQRARNEARSVRAKLAPGKESEPIEAKVLLAGVETVIKLAIAHVDANYPDLGGGSAVLQRVQKFIYVSKEFEEWGDRFCGLVAHELGHWYLDAAKAPTTIAHLKTLLGSEGSPASMKVEAYGVRERQELQANVFARELLLPRELARKLAAKGLGPAKIADNLGIPLEFARQQMLDALLLPAAEESTTPLKEPSPDQIKAAQAAERFANVVAGPGTGKTSTLIHRVKYLIEEKAVDPSHILVLTFTNKAALELVERLRGAGIERAADVWAGTFHAFGLEFLRKFHQRFGLEADLNVADKLTAITALVADLPQLDLKYYLRVEDPYDWLGPVVNGITRLKEELVSPKAYRSLVQKHKSNDDELQRRREDVATLYEAHEALLAKRKTVDFVDLIAKPALAIRDDRAPYSELADKFQYILVDEYQDVTEAMVELLRQLAPKAKSLWVVGDIRQAIHHWRGASLKSLMKFSSVFEAQAGGKKVGRYSLDQNRRSHKEILDLVNEVGKRHRLETLLPLDKMEATKGACGEKPTVVNCAKRADVIGAVIAEVIALQKAGVPYGKQTVLCRNSNDVHRSAEGLAKAGIPIVHIGELAQRPEVKLLLCMMQLLVERQPRALIGLMSIPSLRMSMADIQTLFQASDADVAYQRGRWLTNPPPGLSAAGVKVLTALRKLLGANRHYSNPWSFVCDLILEHRFALPDEKDTSVDAWVQRIALWQFAYAVRNGEGDMKEARLSRFLLRQRLRQRLGETYVDRELPSEASALDGVRVQTVHSSKGLEFDAVHIAYVSADSYGQAPSNWSPDDNALDIVPPEFINSNQAEYDDEAAVERNNLLYVAVSRAKRHLRLYQDNEFTNNLTPQLQHNRNLYQTTSYQAPAPTNTTAVAAKAFQPPTSISFGHFDKYALCSLQYWYAHVMDLKAEQELDSSMRAHMAIMSALKSVAAGASGTAKDHFKQAWADQKLPDKEEDQSLWRDAVAAYKDGLELNTSMKNNGGKFSEPESVVAGIPIRLPWGYLIKAGNSSEFTLVRFARRRTEDIKTLLKPMVNGLQVTGTPKMALRHVLSDAVDSVPAGHPAYLRTTKSYKAAVRLLSGDVQPSRGRHCGRCAYMTICPTTVKLP